MRLRVGILLCLFAILAGIGCRQALAPNVDTNIAPETWITAAPIDTITVERGKRPKIATLPVRFHLYWAGSDQDGAVVGFYWAVVETIPTALPGDLTPPRLPGPKPQDYRFTARTDSTIIFDVAEDIPDRQHAFFIFAVDNEGKADPTPARFVFNALDRFPPLPVFDEAVGTGTVYILQSDGTVQPQPFTRAITDSFSIGTLPTDTVAANARLRFRWHGEPTLAGSVIAGFRYKLDETEFQPPDSLTTLGIKEYNTGIPPDDIPIAAGTKIFTLRAVDQARGTRDVTRRFQLNFSPDTWFSGPDPTNAIYSTTPKGEKYVLLNSLGKLPAAGIPGSLLSPDSVAIMPALRPERRTFFEIYKDTVFVRAEFDTVDMNSWVVFHNGGSDIDSPYQMQVTELARGLPGFPPPPNPVLTSGPPNGSPVGFRAQVVTATTPNGGFAPGAITGLYPVYDPNDFLEFKRIGAYHAMTQAGKAYAVQRAEDGNAARDGRIPNPSQLVERVDNGLGTAYEGTLRGKVMAYYVNKVPYLLTGDPLFRPKAPPAPPDVFTSRNWALRIRAIDPDPFTSDTPRGGPSLTPTLRVRLTVVGTDLNGDPLVFTEPALHLNQEDILLTVPANLAAGSATLQIELCDCALCEDKPGSGRCMVYSIPVQYSPTSPTSPSAQASRPGLD